MQAGDLIQFCYVNGHTRDINNRKGLYLGERPLKRSDGKTINNFAVLLFGDDTERLCDASMKPWIKVLNGSS